MEVATNSAQLLVIHAPSRDVSSLILLLIGLCIVPAIVIMTAFSFVVGVLFLFLVPTLILAYVSSRVSQRILSFDRENRTFEIKEGQMRLVATTTRELSNLREAFLEDRVMVRSDGSDGPRIFRATLRFEDGNGVEEIPISDTFGERHVAEKLAKAVNDWLAQPVDSPTHQS